MTRFPRSIPVLGIFAAALLSATACVNGERHRVEDEWSRSYALAAGGRIEISNANGAIDAQPAAGNAVEVVAKRIVKARSQQTANQRLAEIELRERVSEGRVSIEVVAPSGWGSDTEVRFSVRVPKGVAVELSTANGSVTVSGLAAPVRAETVNGTVIGRALATSEVDASSVNGAVDISLATPLESNGEIDLESVNGRIALQFPAASHATVNAETVNGQVEARGAPFEFATKSRREVRATLNGGGAKVRLETVNGGVSVAASS